MGLQTISGYASPWGYSSPPVVAPATTVSMQPVSWNKQPLAGYMTPPALTSSYTSPLGYPVYCYTLSNGHRVIVEQRPTDIVSLRTFINTGSNVEDPILPSPLYPKMGFPSGIAHLDEHCHFLTTQAFPVKNSWASVVEQNGADYNASTDSEIIQHELTFNREDTPAMFQLHAESVLRPTYNARDIDQEKTNVINEMALRMTPPDQKVYSKLMELLFARPGFQTLGRKEDVAGTRVDQLERFHKTFYTPTNMVTVITGPVDPQAIVAMANQEFGRLPPPVQPTPVVPTRVALRPGEVKSATIPDSQLQHSLVALAFPAPAKANFRDRLTMEYVEMLLGDGPQSLLEIEVKNRVDTADPNRERLANSIGASYSPLRAAGSFQIFAETEPGKEQRVAQASLSLLNRLASQPVSSDKMAEMRDKLMNRFKRMTADVESTSYVLGEESVFQSQAYYLNYMSWIAQITPADVQRVIQTYLNPRTYAVVYGVPARETDSPINALPSIPREGT